MASYVNPLPNGAHQNRYDQGIDFQGKPYDPVVAIGRARVDAVKDDPGGFGKAVYYTLLDGPMKGTQIYVGHALPVVKQGQTLRAGQELAVLQKQGLGNASGLPGWVEIGIAKNGAPAFAAPAGGAAFAKLMKGTQVVQEQPQQTPPMSTDTSQGGPTSQTSQVPVAPDSQAANMLPDSAPPPPDSTHPLILAPGSGGLSDMPPELLTRLWQQISSQPNSSPDTLAYAQNAAIANGG